MSYICINSGFGTQSEYKQKQMKALTLVKSMKLEVQPISSAVGGQFTKEELGEIRKILKEQS